MLSWQYDFLAHLADQKGGQVASVDPSVSCDDLLWQDQHQVVGTLEISGFLC